MTLNAIQSDILLMSDGRSAPLPILSFHPGYII